MKTISSVNNPVITNLAGLKDKTKRTTASMFLIEGYHLVEEALKLNLLVMVLSSNENTLKKFNLQEQYLVTDLIIKKLSTTKTPQDIIGVVRMPLTPALTDLVKIKNLKIVLLDDISDPGNLGTIIRTAAALGYNAVVASNNTVDYYNEKVIRASQGAIFKVKLLKQDLLQTITVLQNNDLKIFGTAVNNAANIQTVGRHQCFGVVFGNEAHGVSSQILACTDTNVTIPMVNDVESLNVGIASAIVMWELSK